MNFEQLVKSPETEKVIPVPRLSIQGEIIFRPANCIVNKPIHSFTDNAPQLNIVVNENDVHFYSKLCNDTEEWNWNNIKNNRKGINTIEDLYIAVNNFRQKWSEYLNNIDPQDLLNKLVNCQDRQYDYQNLTDCSDVYLEQWSEIEVSNELRELAQRGYDLYTIFFPSNSKLRELLDSLDSGTFINISWLPRSNSKWLSHVPWGLMFRVKPKETINPLDFFGLRYRLQYINSPFKAQTENLGSLNNTHRLHYLYWGTGLNPEGKEIATEVEWLRKTSSRWSNQEFVPQRDSIKPKDDVIKSLKSPSPIPVNLMYLYCFCEVGKGNQLELRFDDNNGEQYTLNKYDLGSEQDHLENRPLVFANACRTLPSKPDMANDLKEKFFDRGCAAYLGTETKVPIKLASRFAMIFFHFFYGQETPEKVFEPIPAGEAVRQTRLFLWKYYKNIGGLFYSYIGPYGLYINSDQ